jgi:hypothetical protein
VSSLEWHAGGKGIFRPALQRDGVLPSRSKTMASEHEKVLPL